METLRIVGPNSIVVTAVALIEVLLTVRLVDEVSRKKKIGINLVLWVTHTGAVTHNSDIFFLFLVVNRN